MRRPRLGGGGTEDEKGVNGVEGVLAFRDVTVRYGGSSDAALSGCSFELSAGERVALLGANGSGKTTALAAAVGLLPHDGEIHVLGCRLRPETLDDIRAGVGFLFSAPEDQLLFPRVLDDVAFSLTSRAVAPAAARLRAMGALDELGAAHLAERSPYRLSRGQRVRAALAGALVSRPPLLLLDEPSSGLDPAGRRQLIETLAALPAAMLVATHDLDFARRCCARYVLLEDGRVRHEGQDFDDVAL
jgi:cobalt/nickel transport system ATP-binding protein